MSAQRDDIPSEFEAMRTPPHSDDAEQAVLGGLMLSNSAWEQVADLLREEDFYRQDHRTIYGAMMEMSAADQPFDAVTLSEWLQQRNRLDRAGGLATLATLARDVPTSANVRAYAQIVRERSLLRLVIRAGTELTEAGYQPAGRTAAEIVDLAESKVFEIAEHGQEKGKAQAIGKHLPKTLDRIDSLMQSGSHVTGVPSGINQFDEMTAGLQPGDLIIVAGRPSMGKTAFAVGLALGAALQEKPIPSGVFSMEMSAEQLTTRAVSSVGHIDQQRLRTGQLDDTDWKRVTNAVSKLSKAPVYIDDQGALTPTELRAKARRLKREHGIGLLVVDYLQLMQVPGTKENRATEISEICRSLKALARELSIPVIALSQLNRSLEQRPDKRPVMSDLRESGSIEQDADLIVFIYRDEVYDKESPDKGVAELIIGKQRNGPTGTVRSAFIGAHTRFENFSHDT
jgi:replicative DNA helicase